MKYIIVVPDGIADWPLKELGNKTPLEIARTTNMDFIAQNGLTGLVQTIPDKMRPGSDIGNLSLLGYDPQKIFTGRAPLEAANLGITLAEDEVAFRCNLVTVSDNKMVDYSAGHIKTEEASTLIEALNEGIQVSDVRFYPGKSYRHLMIIKTRNYKEFTQIKCAPPHDILGKEIDSYLPRGNGAQILQSLMERSRKVLENHSVNQVRVDLKENPANMIWLWGQGKKPRLSLFKDRFNIDGSIISAVDLVNGIGRLAGLNVINVPGITGYYDTNYAGKAEYAIRTLKDNDFVFIHIEATDEASHNGDSKMKIACIERIDREIVGTILNHFNNQDDFRIMITPDHATPVLKRTHSAEPVCFAMYGKGIPKDGAENYSERSARQKGLKFKRGKDLLEYFMRDNL